MRKKVALFILFFSFCSLFQNEEQAVVSVVDTDKGKEAIAAGIEINEEKEEIADEAVSYTHLTLPTICSV